MNVLILSPFFRPNIGGVETHLDDLCEYLRKNGHKVYVITYQPLTTKARGRRLEKELNFEVHRVQWFGYNLFPKFESSPWLEFLYLTPALLLHSLCFMLKHAREVNVVHAHGLNCALIAKLVSKIFKKRSVASIHTIYNLDRHPKMAKMVKWALSSFNVILALAERSRKDLTAAGLSAWRIRVYTQWVDQNKFKPMDKDKCKEELGLAGKFVVLFVGRLIEKKGAGVLLEASSKVDPNITFVIIGDGPMADRLKKEASTKKNVVFVGKTEEEYTIKYYNAADIFTIPSQYEEVFARVILEALSCGTPIIAANKGYLPEMIDPSVGVLLDPNVEDIANEVEYLYRNPNELKKLEINCRKYAEEYFSERNAEIIQVAYKTGEK